MVLGQRFIVQMLGPRNSGEFRANNVQMSLNALPDNYCLHSCTATPDGKLMVIAELERDQDPEFDDDPDGDPDDGERVLPLRAA